MNPSENQYQFSREPLGQFDVLVVGAGAAGLYAALCLPQSYRVGLITKDRLSLSASDWAQGGMAAAIASDDSPLLHIEDTLRAGAGLCEIEAVQFLAERARECVESLVELGVGFDRSPDVGLALTLEAAHSRRRVLHASDSTGRAVVSALTAKVLDRQNIQVLSPGFVLSLWLAPAGATEKPENAGADIGATPISSNAPQTNTAKNTAANASPGQGKTRCQGICLAYQNQITWVPARAVVVATGGGGQVFAQTTNPSVSTGDGVAMAWRAGAIVRDLEFFQFHPTALSKKGAPRFLISEAVRGEGAHLVDSVGYRFAFDYHPKGELAPRDTVSRAIFQHLQNSGADPAEDCVWLDLRPISSDRVRDRFPNIIRVCRQWGIDVFTEPVPVAPAAHYWMGGIATDLTCCTSIPGLYAIGETASTGVHGANRLASNSLLECIVFGAQLASSTLISDSILKEREQESERISGVSTKERFPGFSPKQDWLTQQAKLEAIRRELPRLVWQSAGIYRGRAALEEAIERVQIWQAEFAALPLSQKLLNLTPGQSLAEADLFELLPELEKQLRFWGETGNLLDVAYLILTSAAFREESRGGHYRSDFPQADPKWRVHTLVESNIWSKSGAIG